MNEGGSNQPMPLVHDGIVYLTNTMNEVQALDGATGELIWANQVGPNRPGSAAGGMRNIADLRRQDLPGDQRRQAGRARRPHRRHGVDHGRSPTRAKGFTNTSGPIVVKGKVIQGLGGCDRYREERCFISAYDAEDRRPGLEVPHRRAHAASRAATPGTTCPT